MAIDSSGGDPSAKPTCQDMANAADNANAFYRAANKLREATGQPPSGNEVTPAEVDHIKQDCGIYL